MAIGLGRTIGSPVYLFFQIIHGVSLFFVMLGVSRVLLGMLELTSSTTPIPSTMPPASKTSVALRSATTAAAAVATPFIHVPKNPSSSTLPMWPLKVETLANTVSPPFNHNTGAQQTHRRRVDEAADAEHTTAASTTNTKTSTNTEDATAATLPFSVRLSACFHVPLLSLFRSPVPIYTAEAPDSAVTTRSPATTAKTRSAHRYDGSTGRFYAQHLVGAALSAYPLAALLQRRKFVLDFVMTIYVAYWLVTNVMLQAVLGGGTLHWWAACCFGGATMYATTYVLCRRKEMQEVKLSGGGGNGGGGGATGIVGNHVATSTTTAGNAAAAAHAANTSASAATWHKEDAREMEEVRPAFQDAFSPSGVAAVASSAVASFFQDKVGRGRAGGAGVPSPKPAAVVVDMSGADEAPFKSKSI